MLFQKAGDLENRLSLLRAQRDGIGTIRAGPGGADPVRESIVRRKQELEVERVRAIAYNGENSLAVRRITEQIEQCEAQLLGLGPAVNSTVPSEADDRVKNEVDKQSSLLAQIYRRYNAMKEQLAIIKEYQGRLKTATDWRQSFERLNTLQAVRSNSPGSIQEIDKPNVGWAPANAHPQRKVLLGFAGGLAAGIVLALLLELFRGKVRFRNDIEGEFGLFVVGVIPRK